MEGIKKKMKVYYISVPKEINKSMITIGCILMSNIFVLNLCSYFGCYDISFINIFRLNLFCNACTDISYHLQNYQIKIYFAIGGYSLIKMNELVHRYTLNKNPS